MSNRVLGNLLGEHLQHIVFSLFAPGSAEDVLCGDANANLLERCCLRLGLLVFGILDGDRVVLALSGGGSRLLGLLLISGFLIGVVDFFIAFSGFLISNLLSHIHQSDAEKILTPLLPWNGLCSCSSETNAPNAVTLGSLNKQLVSSVQQHLLELLILGKLEVVATFHNAKLDWIPNCVTEGLDVSTQCLLILRGLCDEDLSGNVWVVEGLGFSVHHVLFGGVELDAGVVGVGEGTFLPLREDAVNAISYAEEVDWLRGIVGGRGSHGVDVARWLEVWYDVEWYVLW